MSSYRIFMLGVGSAVGVLLMDRTTAPQSLGIDPGSLWETYSPLILGVIAAILNNGDWPDWVKKIGTRFIEEKGGDIGKGNKAYEAYLKVLGLLKELDLLEGLEEDTRDDLKNVAHALNRKMLDNE
jgi:hypothetical protein